MAGFGLAETLRQTLLGPDRQQVERELQAMIRVFNQTEAERQSAAAELARERRPEGARA